MYIILHIYKLDNIMLNGVILYRGHVVSYHMYICYMTPCNIHVAFHVRTRVKIKTNACTNIS